MKLSEIRKKVKKNRFIFFTYKKMTDHDYRESLKEYSSGCHKSKEKIRKELQQIKDFWKCDPMHYFRYRLFEKDLTYEELIDYVPSYYFYNYHMEGLYGSSDTLVTESKIWMRQFFLERGIDTPISVATVLKGNITGITGEHLSWEKFQDILHASRAEAFFVKPDRGRGGKGIFTIKKIDGQLCDDNNNLLEEWSFLRKVKQDDFLIQEGIIQRSDLKRINSYSVNTLRVVTQRSGNDYRIPVVVLRIGRNKSFVDNSTQGGISVNVDVETGVLARYAYTEHTTERFDRHPDSGFIFEGFALRDWEKVTSEIKKYASKTPEYPEIAWDIVMLENGIIAIEINLQYGIDHLQCCTGGMRRKLNINPVMIGNTVY